MILGALKLISDFGPMIMFERKHLFRTRYHNENPKTLLETHGYKKVFIGPLDTVMAYQPDPDAIRRALRRARHAARE